FADGQTEKPVMPKHTRCQGRNVSMKNSTPAPSRILSAEVNLFMLNDGDCWAIPLLSSRVGLPVGPSRVDATTGRGQSQGRAGRPILGRRIAPRPAGRPQEREGRDAS